MTLDVEVKRWGNSYAVILPKEFVKARNLKEHDRLLLEPYQNVDITKVFGMLKGQRKMTGQQAKNLARSGWG